MKKVLILVAALGLLVAGAGTCFAIGTSVTNFQPYVANNDGNPYFDNNSADGGANNNLNAGFYIQGNGQPNSPNIGATNARFDQLGALPTTATGVPVSFTDGLTDVVKLLALAGDSNVTSFGFFNTATPGVLVPIFANGQAIAPAAGSSVNVNFPASFGLFLTDANSTTFRSTDTGDQHFAIFENVNKPGTLFIAMEDRPFSASDKDYNDMVVELSPVPLPGALLLLGGGLVRLVAYGRRRKNVA